MHKVIKCPFGEEVVITQDKRSEVAILRIMKQDMEYGVARLLPENHLQIIEALLWGLDLQDKHRVIMKVIETMPDFIKQQYAPADKKPKKKKR